MTDIATVVVKATGAAREVSTDAPILLDAASTVTLGVSPEEVAAITRAGLDGQDLLVVLEDGTRVTIPDYFTPHAGGQLSELVLADEEDATWWLRPNPETNGFVLAGDSTIAVPTTVAASAEGAATLATGAVAGGSALGVGIGAGALVLGALAVGGGGGSDDPFTPPPPPVDTTPPPAPTAQIDGTGSTISGTTEANARIRVYDAAGNIIGTATAGADGNYTVTLNPPRTSGEALTVTATDAAGNESAPVSLTAPDLDTDAPEPPTAVISATGDVVSGTAEAGATVTVYDADQNVIGTGVAGTDGRYSITLDPALTAGEPLTVTATDAAGNESDPVDLLAPDLTDTTAPEPPTAVINAAGDTVTGTAEVGATVNVYNAAGVVIGTGIAGTDGRYTLTLDPAQTEGQALTATATDAAGNESAPIGLLAPDLTDNVAPESPTAAIAPDGASISGITEPGATVRVYDADDNVIGTGVAGTDGRYTITLDPALVAGEVVQVTATDAANNESDPTQATAPDLADGTAPDSPTATINAAGDTVTGTADVGTTVTVRDADGNILGTDTAAADGSYSITLDPALTGGEQLSVIATDGDGNDSFPTTIFAPDLTDTTAPDAPTAAINDAGDTVTGRSEAGARIEVRDADNTLLGTATADAGGFFSVTLVPAQTEGQELSVRAIDASDNASAPTGLIAPDLSDNTAPAAPTAAINDTGDMVTGLTEGGARIEVRSVAGDLLGTAVAGTDGRYMVALDPPQINGESLLVTAIDAANNTSPATSITAPDLIDTEAPAAPTAAINDAGDTVTGQTEAGARVEVRDAAGGLLGTALAGSDGRYSVALSPAQTNGQQLAVTASDAAGNTSPSTALTAPLIADTEPPPPPDAVISADGATVSGTAEPLSTVQVLGPGGGVIGSATADANGAYSITLDPPLTSGEVLTVTATDAAGNTSDPTPLTAPVVADTDPPLPPIAIFSADGATVTGTTEAGATVRLFNASGTEVGFAVADGAGSYTITLSPPIIDGQTLTATATDQAGNESGPTDVQAPDLIDRDPPEILAAEVAVNGAAVTGTTDEVGATVTVRDAAGNVLGEGVAGPGGVFSIALTPPLIAGERLSLIATDEAGNASDPTFVNAPNTEGSVIARDDIATAGLDVVPETTEVAEIDSAEYLLLVSLGLVNLQATVLGTDSVSFEVQQGQSLDAVFEYDALLSLGVLSNYQLVVQRWDGTQWTGVAGTGQATLLELNLLTGTPSINLAGLGPGEYRAFMTFNGVGLGLLGDLTVGGTYTDLTSIVDIEGEPATGNVMDGDARTPSTVVQSVEGEAVAASGQTTVAGQYGTLTIDASGAYTYVPSEDAANIGQVDSFDYTIIDTVTGVSSTATLYVRIDSPDVDLVWNDAVPGAPATYEFDATSDTGLAAVEFANVSRGIYDHVENIQLVGLFSTRTYTSAAFIVGENVDVSGSASINMLAAIASSGGLALQQQNAQGAWTNVLNVPYNVLVGLLGPVAQIDLATLDLGPGNYRFVATVRGVGGVGASVNIDVNGTFLDEYQIVDTDGTSGNLLANDVPGSALTQLQVFDAASGTYETVQAGTSVTIQGQYGSLTIDAGGNYTYTPDDDVAYFNQPVTETFDYRLLHPTGDTADGELVITVQPDGAGISAVPDSFDLEAMSAEDAVVDDASGAQHVSGLFENMSMGEPLLVRGEGDQVIELLNSPGGGGFHRSPGWEVDQMAPIRFEDDTDTLLSQQSMSAL